MWSWSRAAKTGAEQSQIPLQETPKYKINGSSNELSWQGKRFCDIVRTRKVNISTTRAQVTGCRRPITSLYATE
jgi:hypothetical protein